eukprot:430662_1
MGSWSSKQSIILSKTQCEIVIHGLMHNECLFSQIIPLSVVNICCNYYYKDINCNLLLWTSIKPTHQRQYRMSIQSIHLYDDSSPKRNISIASLSNNLFKTHNFDKTGAGHCMLSHIVFPKQFINNQLSQYPLLNDYEYDALIRCGGCNSFDSSISNTCELIILDDKLENTFDLNISDNPFLKHRSDKTIVPTDTDEKFQIAYFYQLPSIKYKLSPISVTYNTNTNEIICVGGLNEDFETLKDIYSLNLNANVLEWRKYKNDLVNNVCRSSLCWIDYNKLVVIGGDNHNYSYRTVSLCTFMDVNNMKNKCKYLSRMNFARNQCGSYYDRINNKIIVGGGCNDSYDEKVSRSIEIYDIVKDKWIFYETLMNYTHGCDCVVFGKNDNQNVIYVAGDWMANGLWESFGFVEWIDLRESNVKWNILWNQSIIKQFNVKNSRSRARTLQIY